jgi:hypothetical protein
MSTEMTQKELALHELWTDLSHHNLDENEKIEFAFYAGWDKCEQFYQPRDAVIKQLEALNKDLLQAAEELGQDLKSKLMESK